MTWAVLKTACWQNDPNWSLTPSRSARLVLSDADPNNRPFKHGWLSRRWRRMDARLKFPKNYLTRIAKLSLLATNREFRVSNPSEFSSSLRPSLSSPGASHDIGAA